MYLTYLNALNIRAYALPEINKKIIDIGDRRKLKQSFKLLATTIIIVRNSASYLLKFEGRTPVTIIFIGGACITKNPKLDHIFVKKKG